MKPPMQEFKEYQAIYDKGAKDTVQFILLFILVVSIFIAIFKTFEPDVLTKERHRVFNIWTEL